MSTDDDSEFARLLPGVKRLHNDRVNLYQQRERPGTVTRKPASGAGDRLARHGSASPSIPASVQDSHFNTGMQVKLQRKIRQGQLRPQSSVDLHGCRQGEAIALLEDFLADALQRRLRTVLIIHGQGFRSSSDAVLKPLVKHWLSEQPWVLAWCPAQPRDGAGGASYVYLRTD